MNYLSNALHFILFWLALSLILALIILLLLLAEQENTCQHVSQPASKPLGLVGYIEIHTSPCIASAEGTNYICSCDTWFYGSFLRGR